MDVRTSRCPSERWRWTALVWGLTVVGVGLSTSSCGGPAVGQAPVATLALSSPEAEAYKALHDAVLQSAPGKRRLLETDVRSFRAKAATDSVRRGSDALLSWVLLDKGSRDEALKLAESVRQGPPGTVHDLATVVAGAVHRREGRSAQALRLLAPLVNKIIDAPVRTELNQELVESALLQRRWKAALNYMSIWFLEAKEEQKPALSARVRQGLRSMPTPPKLTYLIEWRSREVDGEADAETSLASVVASQLAEQAESGDDVELARVLLDDWRDLLGDRGDMVAELAVGQMSQRLSTRTVGLLLPLGNAELRRRGAEVASGLSLALGAPGGEFRLVSRDDDGEGDRFDDALTGLSAMGASIIVAGLDAASADAASAFGSKHKVPIVLLQIPEQAVAGKGDWLFVAGESAADELAALRDGLGGGDIATVGGGDAPCTTHLDQPRPAAETVIVQGAPSCAARIEKLWAGKQFGFGLDAAEAAPNDAWVATAGRFPIVNDRPPISAYVASRRRNPSWWAGLGYDVGALSATALRTLADVSTEDRTAMEGLRGDVANALRKAQAELITTEAKGFDATGRLPRSIGARRKEAAP